MAAAAASQGCVQHADPGRAPSPDGGSGLNWRDPFHAGKYGEAVAAIDAVLIEKERAHSIGFNWLQDDTAISCSVPFVQGGAPRRQCPGDSIARAYLDFSTLSARVPRSDSDRLEMPDLPGGWVDDARIRMAMLERAPLIHERGVALRRLALEQHNGAEREHLLRAAEETLGCCVGYCDQVIDLLQELPDPPEDAWTLDQWTELRTRAGIQHAQVLHDRSDGFVAMGELLRLLADEESPGDWEKAEYEWDIAHHVLGRVYESLGCCGEHCGCGSPAKFTEADWFLMALQQHKAALDIREQQYKYVQDRRDRARGELERERDKMERKRAEQKARNVSTLERRLAQRKARLHYCHLNIGIILSRLAKWCDDQARAAVTSEERGRRTRPRYTHSAALSKLMEAEKVLVMKDGNKMDEQIVIKYLGDAHRRAGNVELSDSYYTRARTLASELGLPPIDEGAAREPPGHAGAHDPIQRVRHSPQTPQSPQTVRIELAGAAREVARALTCTTGTLLGEGTFARVYRAELWSADDRPLPFRTPCAVKQFREDLNGTHARGTTRCRLEADMLWEVHGHQGVVTYYGISQDESRLFLELMPMSLKMYMHTSENTKGPVDMPLLHSIARQVLEVLVHCHGLPEPVYHCDLKPDNILIDPKHVSGCLVKVTDWGVSRKLLDDEDAADSTQVPAGGENKCFRGCTPLYLCPEALHFDAWAMSDRAGECAVRPQNPRRTHAADIYAQACIQYEMYTGVTPWVEQQRSCHQEGRLAFREKLAKLLRAGEQLPIPDRRCRRREPGGPAPTRRGSDQAELVECAMPDTLRKVLSACLSNRRDWYGTAQGAAAPQRPTARELLEYEFFTSQPPAEVVCVAAAPSPSRRAAAAAAAAAGAEAGGAAAVGRR